MENNNITLRDYFAGLAMQAYIIAKSNETDIDSRIAYHNFDKPTASYEIADAMIEARDKEKK